MAVHAQATECLDPRRVDAVVRPAGRFMGFALLQCPEANPAKALQTHPNSTPKPCLNLKRTNREVCHKPQLREIPKIPKPHIARQKLQDACWHQERLRTSRQCGAQAEKSALVILGSRATTEDSGFEAFILEEQE